MIKESLTPQTISSVVGGQRRVPISEEREFPLKKKKKKERKKKPGPDVAVRAFNPTSQEADEPF